MTVNNNISSLNSNSLKKISQYKSENTETKPTSSVNVTSPSGVETVSKTASSSSSRKASSNSGFASIQDKVTISAAGEAALAKNTVSSASSSVGKSQSGSNAKVSASSGSNVKASASGGSGAKASSSSGSGSEYEITTLTAKIYSGASLTASELNYLRTESPYLYALATQEEETNEESESDSSRISEIQKQNETEDLKNNVYDSIPGFYGSEDYSTSSDALGSLNANTGSVSLYI